MFKYLIFKSKSNVYWSHHTVNVNVNSVNISKLHIHIYIYINVDIYRKTL